MTSKSFRAVLPRLSDDELERLRAWSAEFCAGAAVFREGDAVIWLASKERARSREAFMRSARGTLERLAIRAKPRGRWLVLADEGTVHSEAARCAPTAAQPPERSLAARAAEELGDRVVALGGIEQAAPQRVVSAAALRRAPAEPSPAASAEEEPGDARVIFLGGTVDGRRSPAGSMQVFKEE